MQGGSIDPMRLRSRLIRLHRQDLAARIFLARTFSVALLRLLIFLWPFIQCVNPYWQNSGGEVLMVRSK